MENVMYVPFLPPRRVEIALPLAVPSLVGFLPGATKPIATWYAVNKNFIGNLLLV
jgi:hypothetical protein